MGSTTPFRNFLRVSPQSCGSQYKPHSTPSHPVAASHLRLTMGVMILASVRLGLFIINGTLLSQGETPLVETTIAPAARPLER